MEETEIQKKVNKNGMIISRIPSWAKDIIIGKADEEHCGDYGACVAQMVRESNEYNCLKRKFFGGELNVKLVNNNQFDEEKPDIIKTGNGKEIKRREQ